MSPILLERRELRTAEQHLPNDILFSLVVRAALPDDMKQLIDTLEQTE